jgi:hypothetical protein
VVELLLWAAVRVVEEGVKASLGFLKEKNSKASFVGEDGD